MQDLHEKLDTLDRNVKALLRKLNDALQTIENVKNENNKLKLKINRLEEDRDSEEERLSKSKIPSRISEDQYHKIKKDVSSYIKEIDECISLIKQ